MQECITRHLDRSIQYRNAAGALFIKDADSMEGYYHLCDGRIEKYIPEIWKHDISSWLYLGNNREYSTWIKFCPICGKSLE